MRTPKRFARLFGDLKVRPKLMVLHNLFFAILVLGVYIVLYPYLPDRTHPRAPFRRRAGPAARPRPRYRPPAESRRI